MNRPVSTELESKFDLVVDGGSLEHIFNFPVAVSNLMRMAVVGGFVMTSNPANNLCGHGFYQLSPELMYRSFSAKNGFRIQELLLVEHAFPSTELRRHGRAVRVRDPAVVGERVIALSGVPLVMKTVARKVEEAAVFADPPQQSDYAVAWKDTEHHGHRARLPRGILRAALDNLPQPIRLLASGYRQRARYRISNRRFFEPYL